MRESRADDSPSPASYLIPSGSLPPGGRMGPPPEEREGREEGGGGPGPGAYDASAAQVLISSLLTSAPTIWHAGSAWWGYGENPHRRTRVVTHTVTHTPYATVWVT